VNTPLVLLVCVLVLGLVFEFVNGFHDAANAIATAVATRVLRPPHAVIMAGVLNFAGAVTGTAVATISGPMPSPSMSAIAYDGDEATAPGSTAGRRVPRGKEATCPANAYGRHEEARMVPAAAQYDAIVIGSGQGGTPLAKALAGAGRRTALVEREYVGGTCVNVGCTPTKTMVASARVAYLVRRAADYGVRTGPVSVEMTKVRDRKRAIVDKFRGGSERSVERTEHLDLIRGEARFTGPHALEVALTGGGTRALGADLIFIDTGARPSRPDLPGLDGVPALDSTSVMELDTVPEHLVVLGGGYVGIEFGQMFRRFGSRVSLVQRARQLCAKEDPDVANAVEGVLREDGIDLVLGAEARLDPPVGSSGLQTL